MDIKQESDEVFEEVKCEIEEHYLPIETIKKEVIFNERNNQLNVIKNELFSIKQENCDKEYTDERVEQIFLKDGSDCLVDADMKSHLVKHNFKKRPKKGHLARRKYMKYWVRHKGILICKFCGKMFNRKFEVFRHAIQHYVQKRKHKHKAGINIMSRKNEQTPLKNFPTHTRTVCIKLLKAILAQNLTTQTYEKPFNCDVCPKSFVNKYHLIKHMRIHTDEKSFKCRVCFKSFAKKFNFTQHFRFHTGEKPFSCEICSKSFTLKGTLVGHMRIHSGEKRFKCEVCSKLLSTKQSLSFHMRNHTDEKPFGCEICSKSFAVKGTLVHHMRIHTGEKPFKCEVCSKVLSTKQSLNFHMRIHTDQKPFKCDICCKYFVSKFRLKNHMGIHMEKIPFKCDVCLKTFAKKHNLARHMTIHF